MLTKSTTIHFESIEWPEMLLRIKLNKRKKFPCYFDNILSLKLHKQGINCWFKCRFAILEF